jgi:hypothetical protein
MHPSIKRCIQIGGGSLKPSCPWIINDIQTVDGVDFVRIHKGDSGFHRFVNGGYKGSLSDTPFLDDLKKKRNIATVTASEEPNIFGNNTKPSDRKRRQLLAAQRDAAQPEVLTIELPPVKCDVGEAAAISMKMRAPTCYASDKGAEGVDVELTIANLHYIRIALLAGIGTKTGARSKPDEPSDSACKWIKRRNVEGYLASRMDDGKKKTKFFHSDVIDPCDVRLMADQWLQRVADGENDETTS